MPKAIIYNQAGEKIGEENLNPAVFGLPVRPTVIQQVVVIQKSNARSVVAHTKDKSQVAGGGRKPWQQKGTGRARHGSIRSPLWRKGGVTFGPTAERNFEKKVNRKLNRKAILMCLSAKAADQQVIVLDQLNMAKPKAKELYQMLQHLSLRPATKKDKAKTKAEPAATGKLPGVLVALPASDAAVRLSARNLPKVMTIRADSLNVLDLLTYPVLVVPKASLAVIEKTFVRA